MSIQSLPIRPLALLLAWFTLPLVSSAQIGGQKTYEFLNLAPSARATALGGYVAHIRDEDLSLALQNPAALNPAMDLGISFSHNFFYGDIQHGYAAFGLHIPKTAWTTQAAIQYINYGNFVRTDEMGNEIGDFTAGEYGIVLGAGRLLYDKLAVGGNLKLAISNLETYSSYGLLADLSAMYLDTARNLTASFVIRNAGAQLTTYAENSQEPLPFEVQAGIAHRLKYLPFRISVLYRYLDRWNITYDDPDSEEDPLFDMPEEAPNNFFVDNLFRHFVFGGEFLFGKTEALRLRFGYNHLRRKELTVTELRSLAGFSFGVGIKINRFRIEYGRNYFHLAGPVNHFTLSTSIRSFTNRRILE